MIEMGASEIWTTISDLSQRYIGSKMYRSDTDGYDWMRTHKVGRSAEAGIARYPVLWNREFSDYLES